LDVTFRPYLGSRNYSDIRNAETSFLSTSGEIGGSVNGEIKLTADDSPYLVVSNIVVEEEDVLTLEGGVVLLFKVEMKFLHCEYQSNFWTQDMV
jgi:hypothetical protein